MQRALATAALCLAIVVLPSAPVQARPEFEGRFELEPPILESARQLPLVTAQDTTWIADWTFDAPGGGCDASGWTAIDHTVRNDGSNDWSVGPDYDGQGFVSGNAAILRRQDPCWVQDGYGNAWDEAVVLRYRGAGARLSFDFASDSEPGYDFVRIEADSLGASGARAAATSPPGSPESFRKLLSSFDGPQPNGRVSGLALPDFGLPDSTHCVYVRFVSDGPSSDQDGEYLSSIAAALVVDNIVVTGTLAYVEDFEDGLDPRLTLANTAPSAPYATFARLVHQPLDLDPSADDSTCAWTFSDPTFACNGGGAVPPCVRPLVDNSIMSPWVPVPGPGPLVLAFREWPSNAGSGACTVRMWAIRARTRQPDLDTPAPDDSIDCETPWSGGFAFPNSNSWVSRLYDASAHVPADARAVQVRFRVLPLASLIGHEPNPSCAPAPGGPLIDRVRLGRIGTPSAAPPAAVGLRTALLANVPNPFNPVTTIRFDLGRPGHVGIAIFDVAGRRVRGLLDVELEAGAGRSVEWTGRDDAGRKVPSGVYFCRLVTDDTTMSRALVLLE